MSVTAPSVLPAAASNTVDGSQPLKLFDTHCHFDLPELASEQQMHWHNAQQVGVSALLIPAVQQSAWQNLLNLQKQRRHWHIALGIHPWWAAKAKPEAVTELEAQLIQHLSQIAAVGEIGLDFALDTSSFDVQQMLFSRQLELAGKYHKPVILHHRKSQPQLLAELKRQQFTEGGILHAFSGSQQQAMAFVDLGFKLGIGGTITYDRAEKTRRSVSKLPLSSFVLETDAPAMPLAGFQGQINTPAQLALVFAAFCQLRPEPPEHIAASLWHNTMDILRLGTA
ncbi:MAG: TatD family hydrolase [Gammaproteobacteria bacterium]|nr:TatD family hydrolase [Gammaproteobacteria bacterium]MBU1553507.1 TatD family hydrolase [Gammaproteobacteria bacterium]MBU2069285.1 TatD family hydrolase [Gammaproteobacteria bacterium]MBU2183280.1 TatD family hydrolase [Gammaproteobacteria bacterium]MBU2204495.1 TatD family hydrolase [Gammaproteobacteria bacterium]